LSEYLFVAVHINRAVGVLEVVSNLDDVIFVKCIGFACDGVDISKSLYAPHIFNTKANIPTELGNVSP
jgi:hypothetical protein